MMNAKEFMGGTTVVLAGVVSLGMLFSGAAEAANEKVAVCNNLGNGEYHLVDVSDKALPALLRKGAMLPGQPYPGEDGYVFGPDCSLESVAKPVVETGYSGLTEEGAVRFRQNNGGGEIYLGEADLGIGGNRVEGDYAWTDGVFEVTFAYDGLGTISTFVGAVELDYAITPSCGDWNTMDVLVVDRSDETAVAFENVELNGFALGNFGSFDIAGTFGFQNWAITAFDFSQPWILTGELVIENFSGSAEANKLQLTVGCLP